MRGAIATGQLARLIDVPWRSSGSSASPTEDAQGAWETMFNLQGAIRGGANIILHSAGWQEGGLVASLEKLILDVEILHTIVESWQPIDMSADELAFDAIAGVEPGGHFFGEPHTLERFETAFYDPIVAARVSFEQWVEDGNSTLVPRANGSGSSGSPSTNSRRSTMRSSPNSTTSWLDARPRAARRLSDRRLQFGLRSSKSARSSSGWSVKSRADPTSRTPRSLFSGVNA